MVKERLESLDQEQFIIACLNTKNEPTNISVVAVETLNKAIVHPREVFKTAILSNAASIMAFHNHPSGNTEPSHYRRWFFYVFIGNPLRSNFVMSIIYISPDKFFIVEKL